MVQRRWYRSRSLDISQLIGRIRRDPEQYGRVIEHVTPRPTASRGLGAAQPRNQYPSRRRAAIGAVATGCAAVARHDTEAECCLRWHDRAEQQRVACQRGGGALDPVGRGADEGRDRGPRELTAGRGQAAQLADGDSRGPSGDHAGGVADPEPAGPDRRRPEPTAGSGPQPW